ncbi:hypothetical protein AVEN_175117-1 [Araneus ventricosus]|uniref:Uncharacterized protein n=1 Tax=Araneus ventricosus TaxID=182803 RepID=A0A4Y2MYW4_ARAVE|nr:hypothetical protein AVEN_175117-1 [Araneus ventricosus]
MRKMYFTCIKNFKHESITEFEKRYVEVRVNRLKVPTPQNDLMYRLIEAVFNSTVYETSPGCFVRHIAGHCNGEEFVPFPSTRLDIIVQFLMSSKCRYLIKIISERRYHRMASNTPAGLNNRNKEFLQYYVKEEFLQKLRTNYVYAILRRRTARLY